MRGRLSAGSLQRLCRSSGRGPRYLSAGANTTGADLIVEALVASGVEAVFGIPGNHTVPFYRALEARQADISHTQMRHEGGAAFAADGYSRATGKLAAVSTITGTAAANTLSAMASARADSVPMVVLTSEASSFWRSKPARQYSHFVPNLSESMARSFAKSSSVVERVEEIESVVREACQNAVSGQPGPVHVSIPLDLFGKAAPESRDVSEKMLVDATVDVRPDALEMLTRGAQKLWSCQRPLIIVGAGAKDAAASVTALAEKLQAPVVSTPCGKGVLDDRHALSGGCRLHHRTAFDEYCSQVDGLLLLGTKLSPTDFWSFDHHTDVPIPWERLGGNVLHVDVDADALAQVGAEAAGGAAVQADVSLACQHLLRACGEHGAPPARWQGQAETSVSAMKQRAADPALMTRNMLWDFTTVGSGGELMRTSLRLLRDKLPDAAPLVSDVCRIGYTALSEFPCYRPRTFLYPVGTTTLGYGLPAAVGAAVAQPGTPVAVLLGDGGLQFTMQEMAVAACNDLPILMFLWNDESYGEIRRGLGDFATQTPKPDFGLICKAYGMPHFRVSNQSGIEEALLAAPVANTLAGKGGPVMIEVMHPWNPPPK